MCRYHTPDTPPATLLPPCTVLDRRTVGRVQGEVHAERRHPIHYTQKVPSRSRRAQQHNNTPCDHSTWTLPVTLTSPLRSALRPRQ